MILIKKFPEGSTCDKGKYWGITKQFLDYNNIEWWQDGNGHLLVDCDEQIFKNLKKFNFPKCLGDYMKEAIIVNPIIVSPKENHDDTWFFSRSDTQNFYLVKKSA
nr:MAG TPA: hypothetical protein [Caudoviricetes sp.]